MSQNSDVLAFDVLYAKHFGVNGAVIIERIKDGCGWNGIFSNKDEYRDGHYWFSFSVSGEGSSEFPWLSRRGLQDVLHQLVACGAVLKMPGDRTGRGHPINRYRIDMNAVDKLIAEKFVMGAKSYVKKRATKLE